MNITNSTSNNIKECVCSRYQEKVLTTFKVSDNLTYLICIRCGGKYGEWIKKIYPPALDFNKMDLEDMT